MSGQRICRGSFIGWPFLSVTDPEPVKSCRGTFGCDDSEKKAQETETANIEHKPGCPAGGAYTLHTVDERCTGSILTHVAGEQ